MALGILFRKLKWIDEPFAMGMNKFVFKVALPVLLFEDLSTVAFDKVWDFKFAAFCFLITLACIVLLILAAILFVKKEDRGEFVQGAYRSSVAILGIAFIKNIYDDSGMAPLMIVATVPLYNVAAVMVLALMNPSVGKIDRKALKKAMVGVITNPIIWGIVLGVIFSAVSNRFSFEMPVILSKVIHNVAVLATPLGLISMGASFEGKKALAKIRVTAVCSFIKLFGLAAIGLTIAYFMGFRDKEMVAILTMLGSSTTVSSYIMSKNMGSEGTLSASVVMVTTLFSAVSLTMWLYLLRVMNLI